MTKNREIEVREASDLVGKEWYDLLIVDCAAIISESSETSRWALIEGYHLLGRRILEDRDMFMKQGMGLDKNGGMSEAVQLVAQSLGKSTRTIYQAVQFASKFPKAEDLPGGKGITWHKVCNTVLVGKEIQKECSHSNVKKITVCADCGRHIK
jgi:hypothetical protein